MDKRVLKALASYVRRQVKLTDPGAIDRLLETKARVVNRGDGPALRVNTRWDTPEILHRELNIYLSVEQGFIIGWSGYCELPGGVELACADAFERVWRRTLDHLRAHAEHINGSESWRSQVCRRYTPTGEFIGWGLEFGDEDESE
jgi:hypothetical protein